MICVAQQGAALLGGILRDATPLHGGDLSQVVRIALDDGRVAVVKTGKLPEAEADMLRAIAATGAPAPQVLAVGGTVLALQFIEGGDGLDGAWESLAAALAQLHGARGSHYGWHCDYAFGPVAIENAALDDWPTFWGARRLVTHCAHIPPSLARRIESLAADLTNRLPHRPAASLLHGDLWSGNILAARGHVAAFIDPACVFGHAEADLAMLRLFDRPGPAFEAAYGPPEPGHAERLPIYQLWPALVHLRLFGRSYQPLVDRFLAETGV